MKCGYSKETLALYIEDDLPAPEAVVKVTRHVNACPDCRQYCEQLQKSQSWIKSRCRPSRHEAVSSETLSMVRRAVLSQIHDTQRSLGRLMKLERMLTLGFRKQGYAVAGFAVVAIVSASLLGQMRHSRPEPGLAAAVFVGANTLVRPASYREWVFVGSSLGLRYDETPASPAVSPAVSQGPEMYHNVYIDPAGYREYANSGKFPDGTVMVLEMVSAEAKKEPGLQGSYGKDFMALEVSVKDSSRFEEGWGYFDFTAGMGTLKSEAEPIPQSAGCISCHRDKAATDHVFTQFYPVLKSARS